MLFNRPIACLLTVCLLPISALAAQTPFAADLKPEIPTYSADSASETTNPFGPGSLEPQLPAGVEFLPSTDGWIYETTEARDLVQQARQFDPLYSPVAQRNRDKAVELYQAAIEAQPGAVVNAALANRIAQLLAFNEDRQNGVFLKPAEAAEWWKKCGELTSSKQLLWAQSRMGLASTGVIRNSPQSSLPYLDEILQIDPDSLELESWKKTSYLDNPRWREMELQRLRRKLIELQETVGEKKQYLKRAVTAREIIQKSENETDRALWASGNSKWQLILLINSIAVGGLLLILALRKRAQKQ